MILRASSRPFFRKRPKYGTRADCQSRRKRPRDALRAIRKFVARNARRWLKGQHIERLSLSVQGSLLALGYSIEKRIPCRLMGRALIWRP
jgi:hypothetical protein